jgi:hypothetical protein
MNRRRITVLGSLVASAALVSGAAVTANAVAPAAPSPAAQLLTTRDVGRLQPQLGAWTNQAAWVGESFTCEPESVRPAPKFKMAAKFLAKQPLTDYVKSANRVLWYSTVEKAKAAETAYKKAAAGGCYGHHRPNFVNKVTVGRAGGSVYEMMHRRPEWSENAFFEMVGVGRSGKTVTLVQYTNYGQDNNYEPGKDFGSQLLRTSLKKLG